MKTKIIILALVLISESLLAQFTIIQPEVFRLATIANAPCPASDKGKIFFHTNHNLPYLCHGNQVVNKMGVDYWEGAPDIYYLGKIGISIIPTYDLDVNGSTRINAIIVNGNVGVNTLTPTEKLELVNRDIYIKSSADETSWRIFNNDAGNRLEWRDLGLYVMQINYGGNIVIGTPNSITDKLKVDGDVAYAGSLSVEGKGTLANTDEKQLVMQLITSNTTSGSYTISNNTCGVVGFNFGSNQYTNPPVVILGQNISLTEHGPNLVKSIDSVTTLGGSIRVCNNTGGLITFFNQTYSLIAIGEL